MKLSRRKKSARRVRHTKRAGKKLRYKSKKFRALKRYHRRGGRHTKKLYGRRVKKGGEVTFGDPSTSGERSESGYTYTLTGTIKPKLRYKKIGSVMSDTSPFDIEITASRIVKTENNTPVTINITFTRTKLPNVTYTISSVVLDNIVESISNPNIAVPKITGVYTKTDLTAKYEFSFKDNVKDFTTILDKVKTIEDYIGTGTIHYKGTSVINKKRENEDEIEGIIKKDEVLKINIAPLGQEDKKINYPAEIKKLQKQVADFKAKHPDKIHEISRANALMAIIPDLLLGLLVGVHSNRLLKMPTADNHIKQANLFTSLTDELTSICGPPAASPYDNDPVDSAAPLAALDTSDDEYSGER